MRAALVFVTGLLTLTGVASFPSQPAAGFAGAAAEGPAILTFHNDLSRTGWTADERTLVPSAIRRGPFGKLWTSEVDGAIYAEPLVQPGLAVLGRVRTVLYVVTEHNHVYALDAADGKRLWGPVSLGTPVPRASLQCGNIDPVGITGTPVVDPGAGTVYVVALTTPDEGRTKAYAIAALDVKSGAMRPGWPVPVTPPQSSGFRFNPAAQLQRGALTLLRGVVYVPFGGYFGDCGDYHGWVVGVPGNAPAHQQAFATPTGRMGAIWATGGLAADAQGNLYASTGNSDSTGRIDLGNAVFRLTTAPSLRFSGAPADFFMPSNFVSLNDTDTDLGSSAPLVLPDQPGSATPHLLFIAGKQGVGYLINRDAMGGVSKGNGVTGEALFSRCLFGTCNHDRPQVFSAAAYWDGGTAGRLILVPGRGRQPAPCAGTGGVLAVKLGTAQGSRSSNFTVAWCSSSMIDPGAPAVSGAGPDGGVVWALDTGSSAVLHAFEARTGATVYTSAGADAVGRTQRFVTPAVAGGRVYVGAGTTVLAYGLK